MKAYEFLFVLRVDRENFVGVEVVDTFWDNHFISKYTRTDEILKDYAGDREHKYYLVHSYCDQTMFGLPETHYHAVVYEYFLGSMTKCEMDSRFFEKIRVAMGDEYYKIYTQIFNVAKYMWLDQIYG